MFYWAPAQVTDVVFLERQRSLVSASKDTMVRVWDLDTRACVQTVVGHRCEVWSLDCNPAQTRVVTAGADAEMRFFSILDEDETRGGTSQESQEAQRGGDADESTGLNAAESGPSRLDVLRFMGSVRRQSTDRGVTVRYNSAGNLLGCHGAGKAVELYR